MNLIIVNIYNKEKERDIYKRLIIVIEDFIATKHLKWNMFEAKRNLSDVSSILTN